jgi:LacI family transcriptional regulator
MRSAGAAPRFVAVNRMPDSVEAWRHDRRVLDMVELLRAADRPTAVIAYSIKFALPVLIAAGRAGLTVPGDLSLATFEDDLEQYAGEPITYIRTDMRGVGREAVRMLQEKMAAPERDLSPRALPVTLIEGHTTGVAATPLSG